MRLLGPIARIHIIQVRAKRRLRLRRNHRVLQPIHERHRLRVPALPVVLEHPQTVSVPVGGEVRIPGVDLAPRPAVQVDDGVERYALGGRRLRVGVEGVERGGAQAGGFRHREGLREEGVVLGVAREGLFDGRLARHEDQVVVPGVGLHGDVSRLGHAAQELGLDARGEFLGGAEEGAGEGEGAVVVEVDAEGDAVVDDGRVAREVLQAEEGGREG